MARTSGYSYIDLVTRPSDACARRLASTALAQAISDRRPGAATLSPAMNTPSPRVDSGTIEPCLARLVEGLAWHRLRAGGPPGLVLGFANLAAPAIERGVGELARALEIAV